MTDQRAAWREITIQKAQAPVFRNRELGRYEAYLTINEATDAIAEAVALEAAVAERKLAEIDTHCEALLMSVNSYEAEAKLARRILAIVRGEK